MIHFKTYTHAQILKRSWQLLSLLMIEPRRHQQLVEETLIEIPISSEFLKIRV